MNAKRLIVLFLSVGLLGSNGFLFGMDETLPKKPRPGSGKRIRPVRQPVIKIPNLPLGMILPDLRLSAIEIKIPSLNIVPPEVLKKVRVRIKKELKPLGEKIVKKAKKIRQIRNEETRRRMRESYNQQIQEYKRKARAKYQEYLRKKGKR